MILAYSLPMFLLYIAFKIYFHSKQEIQGLIDKGLLSDPEDHWYDFFFIIFSAIHLPLIILPIVICLCTYLYECIKQSEEENGINVSRRMKTQQIVEKINGN